MDIYGIYNLLDIHILYIHIKNEFPRYSPYSGYLMLLAWAQIHGRADPINSTTFPAIKRGWKSHEINGGYELGKSSNSMVNWPNWIQLAIATFDYLRNP
jgi:hypothetical protein